MFSGLKKKRIYLDYAAATPVSPEVLSAMTPFFKGDFGNPSSIHNEGVNARNAIEEARSNLAQALHIRPDGIIFTGSGTECNNIAIMGIVETHRKKGVAYVDMHIISTAIEHASVFEVLKHLETLGVAVTFVAVDGEGIIKTALFKESLTPKTILVAISYVNSEIGVIQPIGKLARIVRAYEKEMMATICIHVDAAQAPLWLPCSLDSLSCDTLALDAGKCYGPKGIGVLAIRHGIVLEPYLFGGGQERGLRSGTENTALIVGGALALCSAQQECHVHSEEVTALRDFFIVQLLKIEGVVLNGSPSLRVANNVNISIEGIDAEFAIISLNEKGIACATKSACGSQDGAGSSVVNAISHDPARALSSLRFSLGLQTTKDELNFVAVSLEAHVLHTRKVLQNLTA